ncbi:MAG TPA: hypothetical protein VFR47_12910 [Anaerolineales bacterium]|nr:hypothetical protein [Anaerolineales bacterium]
MTKFVGEGWQVFYAYFSRARFKEAARQEAQAVNALLVVVETLDKELSGA